jgi:hypothetical protein
MKDSSPSAPHFLRVVRALARVSGVAAPVVVVTTGLAGGCSDAGQAMGVAGGGGSITTSSTSHTGGATTTTSSSTSTSLGSGGFVGMPDAGGTTDGGDGGH